MAVLSDDMGGITAYAAAVNRGYTGTKEEFEQLMYSYTEVAERAEAAAGNAHESEENSIEAKDISVSAKNEAVSARDVAVSARDASISAKNNSESARDAAISVKNDTLAAKDAVMSAKSSVDETSANFSDEVTAAISDVNAAGRNQKELAKTHAVDSEAWAVGQREGADVGVSDTTYHNNSKYYAEQSALAKSETETARDTAITAKNNAVSAKNEAETARGQAQEIVDGIQEQSDQIQINKEDISDLKSDLNELSSGSINLLNPADFQQGKYLVAGGWLGDNANLTASGFFAVEPNTTYYIYRSDTRDIRVAYYSTNSESGYIDMDSAISASTNTFTTRTGSKYVRISTNSAMILDMGIYSADIRYYIPYQLRLASGVSIENHIDNALTDAKKAAPANAVGQIKAHVIFPENCVKFGDTGMIVNERLDLSNGNIVTNSSGQARTDFIPVNVGDYVQTCAIRNICLYDDQYAYLGYINLWSENDAVAPPSTWSGNYCANITQIEAVNGISPAYIRCWGRTDAYPPAITMLSSDPYKVVNLGDSIFGNNEKPWDLGTYIQNITGLKDANCGYGGTTARVIPSGNMSPLGLPSIVDCIVSEDFSSLQTPAYWANLHEYRYAVPTLLFSMVDFSEVEIITIAYGTNDWNSSTPLDNTDNRLDTSTYKGGLRYAVENLQTKYPAITIVMLSPIFRYWSNASDYSTVDQDSDTRTNSLGLKLTDYVTAMQEVAEEYHLPYFDNYKGIGLNKYTAPTWLRDGTHLNRGIGVDKMGHIVAREVNQIY